MTLLLLVRHALTEATGRRLSGNMPGLHLSDRGRQQAEGLAERLAPVSLAALYSSPLERCVETAQLLARGRRLDVMALPGVKEVEYGRWTGRPLAQLARTTLWKQLMHSPSAVRFPDGETLTEVQRRSVNALDELAARHPKGRLAVVTHADVIRLVLAHYAGIHIDLFQRLIVSPASVTAVGLGDRIPRILRTNDTGGFDDLLQRSGPGGTRPGTSGMRRR